MLRTLLCGQGVFDTDALMCYHAVMRTSIDIPDELWEQSKALCAKHRCSFSELVRRGLSNHVGSFIFADAIKAQRVVGDCIMSHPDVLAAQDAETKRIRDTVDNRITMLPVSSDERGVVFEITGTDLDAVRKIMAGEVKFPTCPRCKQDLAAMTCEGFYSCAECGYDFSEESYSAALKYFAVGAVSDLSVPHCGKGKATNGPKVWEGNVCRVEVHEVPPTPGEVVDAWYEDENGNRVPPPTIDLNAKVVKSRKEKAALPKVLPRK